MTETNASHQPAVAAAITLDTAGFGEFLKALTGSNPFDTHPLFDNINVGVTVASQTTALPDGVSLPAPLSSTTIKEGFCFDGVIAKPSDCGKSAPCQFVTKHLLESSSSELIMKGCINTEETSPKPLSQL